MDLFEDNWIAGFSNRLSMISLELCGNIFDVMLERPIENLTNPLERKFGLNLSLVSCCLAKSISVLVTFLAFEEIHKVTTITIPAINRRMVGVGTLVAKTSIENSVAWTPETLQAS